RGERAGRDEELTDDDDACQHCIGQLPRLPSRLLAHLRRWHRIHAQLGVRFVCHYQGSKVRSLRPSRDTARRAARLGEDVTPHALRRTAATWLMQRGCDMWEA